MADTPRHLVRAGTPHTLKKTRTTDLVYLMGGEHRPVETARMPSVGKTLLFSASDGVRAFDGANARQLTLADCGAKDGTSSVS
jgi:uncharacterized cupin superfamily protein